MDSENKSYLSDSAILFLDSSQNTNSSTNKKTTINLDGHQILDQVQRELQFMPTIIENAYVTGTILSSKTSDSDSFQQNREKNLSSVIVTGTIDQESRKGKDTDFLVDETINFDSQTYEMNSSSKNINSKSKFTIWEFEYYSQYFQLTTDIFFRRILWSLLPLTGGNKGTYIDRYIQSNPDMYGPFWIPITLAFTISICNDIIRHLNFMFSFNNATQYSVSSHQESQYMSFNFNCINMALTITFTYVIIAPMIVWSFCYWRRCTKMYTFLECLCSYGYSLSLFIPITVLCLINIRQVQFILFASAAFLSGSVLLISFAPVMHSDPNRSFKFAYVMLIFILLAHLILSLFYLYFFF